MSFGLPDAVVLYVVGATVALVVWSVAVYFVEVRRTGSTPWSEWYNDRVVPLWQARHPSSDETGADEVKTTPARTKERKAA